MCSSVFGARAAAHVNVRQESCRKRKEIVNSTREPGTTGRELSLRSAAQALVDYCATLNIFLNSFTDWAIRP
jgi:hypothetical protein